MFNKIKNFEQLKEEVFEMKKSFQKTYDDVSSMKNKFSMINDKIKDINKVVAGTSSFEQVQEDTEFKNLMREKIEEIDKKFKVVLGDFKVNDDDNEENKDNIENVKSKKKSRKNKLSNLLEINKKINQYQQSKVEMTDFILKNEENDNNMNKINNKLNDILTCLYGNNYEDKITSIEYDNSNNKNNSLFTTKNEFDKYKTKTDEEINKIWEKIESLNKLYEEIFAKINDNCTLNDLDAMKNLILEKTQELFLNMKNKNIENSSIKILQKNFQRLLELLAEKEDKENFFKSKKSLGGYSCASCENYIGDLNDDTKRHIHWKKLPIKIKDKENENKIYKIGNGYSRFLKMINFNNKGIPSLNPLENIKDYTNTARSNFNENSKSKDNELNKSGHNHSIHSISSKYLTSQRIETKNLKTRNKLDISEKRLPNVMVSNSTDNFDNNGKKINPSLSSFNFRSPRLKRIHKKKHYKFDL